MLCFYVVPCFCLAFCGVVSLGHFWAVRASDGPSDGLPKHGVRSMFAQLMSKFDFDLGGFLGVSSWVVLGRYLGGQNSGDNTWTRIARTFALHICRIRHLSPHVPAKAPNTHSSRTARIKVCSWHLSGAGAGRAKANLGDSGPISAKSGRVLVESVSWFRGRREPALLQTGGLCELGQRAQLN